MIPMMQAGQFGKRRPFDPYRAWCKLLLHCDGADASATFTDSGPLAKTVTVFGNAQVDTSQAVFDGSLQCDGTGDYLRVPNNGDFDFGSGNFFMRFRLKADGVRADSRAFIGAWGSSQNSWVLYKNGGTNPEHDKLVAYISSSGTTWDIRDGASPANATSIVVVSMSAFEEIGFGRSGSTFGIWENGTSVQTFTSASALYSGGTYLFIGADPGGNASLLGREDEIHILKGICPVAPGTSYLVAKVPFPNAG